LEQDPFSRVEIGKVAEASIVGGQNAVMSDDKKCEKRIRGFDLAGIALGIVLPNKIVAGIQLTQRRFGLILKDEI
jgi:phosphoribosylaminoimidazole (AIR) synthetase